jgi:tetratricopeptide (TPR) repeat protein
MLSILQGEALEKQKLRVLSLSAMEFVTNLCYLPRSFAALDFAEKILREAPWEKGDRVNLLADVFWNRAVLYCDTGDYDLAMAALNEIPEVLRELDKDDAPREATEPPFLTRLAEERSASEHWRAAADSVELPKQLKALREREDYKALVREMRMHF